MELRQVITEAKVLVLHIQSIRGETLYQVIHVQNMSSEVEHCPAEIKYLFVNVPVAELCTIEEDFSTLHH